MIDSCRWCACSQITLRDSSQAHNLSLTWQKHTDVTWAHEWRDVWFTNRLEYAESLLSVNSHRCDGMLIPSRDARPILRGDCLHSRRRVNIAAREANEGRVRVISGAAVLGSELGLLFGCGCCSVEVEDLFLAPGSGGDWVWLRFSVCWGAVSRLGKSRNTIWNLSLSCQGQRTTGIRTRKSWKSWQGF